MTEGVKIAIIIATGIIAAVGIYVYFSPYQTCVRATQTTEQGIFGPIDRKAAQRICADNSD